MIILFFFFVNSDVHTYGRFLSPDYGFQLAQGFSPTIPGFLCFVYLLLLCLPKLQRQETVKLNLIKIWHTIRYLGVSPHVGRLQRTATESILLSPKGTFSWSARSSAFGRSLESGSILWWWRGGGLWLWWRSGFNSFWVGRNSVRTRLDTKRNSTVTFKASFIILCQNNI